MPLWLPTDAIIFSDFSTEGGDNHYWSNGAQRAGLAAWLADLGGSEVRATGASDLNASGLLEQVASGVLRFNHDPAGAFLGALIEAASTNRTLRSNTFSNAYWTDIAGTLSKTQNATGPDGVANSAWTIQNTTNANTAYELEATPASLGANVTRTLTLYGKIGTGQYLVLYVIGNNANHNYINAWFDLGAGAGNATQTLVGSTSGTIVGTPKLVIGPNGFFRAQLIGSINDTAPSWGFGIAGAATGNTTSAFGQPVATLAGAKNIIVFGAQFEDGSAPSTYIPTTTAIATRNADALSLGTLPTNDGITFTFDDSSTQALTPGAVPYSVPTNLSRPNIGTIAVYNFLTNLWLADAVRDSGLSELGTSDAIFLCPAAPADYSAANASKLAQKVFGTGNVFGGPQAATDGRKVISAPITDGDVLGVGGARCWVAVDTPGSRMLAYGKLDADLTTVMGHAFSLDPISVHLPR